MNNIILIGMPGCGKTTIGRLLAEKLSRKFIDSDKVFEETVCPDISEYFSAHGQDNFRKEETNILRNLCQGQDCVIATGGGIVERPENKEILQNGGTVVFVNRSPEDIVGDVDTSTRPLLAEGRNKIFDIYEKRYKKYIDFCHIQIENHGTLDAVINKITDEVNSYNG